jgi:hypothetical protein
MILSIFISINIKGREKYSLPGFYFLGLGGLLSLPLPDGFPVPLGKPALPLDFAIFMFFNSHFLLVKCITRVLRLT